MTQTDGNVANQTFPSFRSDLNNILESLITKFAGASAPSTTFANMWWIDTTNSLIKIRDNANTAWITVGRFGLNGLNVQTHTTNPSTAKACDYVGQIAYDTTNNRAYMGKTATGTAATSYWDIAPFVNGLQMLKVGCEVVYASDATATVKKGSWVDSTGKYVLNVTSDLTLNIANSGALGRDTGAEAGDTWYYVYLIGKVADPTAISAVLSIVNGSAPTYPSGYDIYRQLPIAIRNDGSSNFLRWILTEGWPHKPVVYYPYAGADTAYRVLNSGSATTAFANPGGGANVSCAALVPPISRKATFFGELQDGGANGRFSVKDPDAATTTGKNITTCESGGTDPGFEFSTSLDSSQQFAYNVNSASNDVFVYCQSYTVTEVY